MTTVQVPTSNSIDIICERCHKHELVDYPENLWDFQYKYGFTFCEDCMMVWVSPKNELRDIADAWAARGKR